MRKHAISYLEFNLTKNEHYLRKIINRKTWSVCKLDQEIRYFVIIEKPGCWSTEKRKYRAYMYSAVWWSKYCNNKDLLLTCKILMKGLKNSTIDYMFSHQTQLHENWTKTLRYPPRHHHLDLPKQGVSWCLSLDQKICKLPTS